MTIAASDWSNAASSGLARSSIQGAERGGTRRSWRAGVRRPRSDLSAEMIDRRQSVESTDADLRSFAVGDILETTGRPIRCILCAASSRHRGDDAVQLCSRLSQGASASGVDPGRPRVGGSEERKERRAALRKVSRPIAATDVTSITDSIEKPGSTSCRNVPWSAWSGTIQRLRSCDALLDER